MVVATGLTVDVTGVFDAVPLMVKEPTGEFRPENEWTRGGKCSGGRNHIPCDIYLYV